MKIIRELDLDRPRAWSGAVEMLDRIRDEEKTDALEAILEDLEDLPLRGDPYLLEKEADVMTETMRTDRQEITVTDQDIDDIMVTALEGGIDYWCGAARVEGGSLGERASEQISRGGTLYLDDLEGGGTYTLDREKFMKGLKKFLDEYAEERDLIFREDDLHTLDGASIDACDADTIIQCAVFGELMYG